MMCEVLGCCCQLCPVWWARDLERYPPPLDMPSIVAELAKMELKSGFRAGREAARIPRQSSTMFQTMNPSCQ